MEKDVGETKNQQSAELVQASLKIGPAVPDPAGVPVLYANITRAAYGPEEVQVTFYRVDPLRVSDAMDSFRVAAERHGHTPTGSEGVEVFVGAEFVCSVVLPFSAAARLRDSIADVLKKWENDNIFGHNKTE